MAITTGSAGTVTIPSMTELHVTKWSANITREVFDTSTFAGADNAKTKTGGLATLTGSIEGFMDSASAVDFSDLTTQNQAPTAAFILATKTGNTYTFDGLLQNIAIDSPKSGMATYTANFTGSSEIVEAGG